MARSSVRTHLPIQNEKKNKQTNQTKAQCRLLLNISKTTFLLTRICAPRMRILQVAS